MRQSMLDFVDFSEHVDHGALEKNNDDFLSFAFFFVEDFVVYPLQLDKSLQLLFHQLASFG